MAEKQEAVVFLPVTRETWDGSEKVWYRGHAGDYVAVVDNNPWWTGHVYATRHVVPWEPGDVPVMLRADGLTEDVAALRVVASRWHGNSTATRLTGLADRIEAHLEATSPTVEHQMAKVLREQWSSLDESADRIAGLLLERFDITPKGGE